MQLGQRLIEGDGAGLLELFRCDDVHRRGAGQRGGVVAGRAEHDDRIERAGGDCILARHFLCMYERRGSKSKRCAQGSVEKAVHGAALGAMLLWVNRAGLVCRSALARSLGMRRSQKPSRRGYGRVTLIAEVRVMSRDVG
jgi:hypothetical protein